MLFIVPTGTAGLVECGPARQHIHKTAQQFLFEIVPDMPNMFKAEHATRNDTVANSPKSRSGLPGK
jgi:hypothetical protein